MTEASRDPEVTDPENPDNGRTALNLTCSTTSKSKPLPDRGSWSTKLDFILSVVMHFVTSSSILLITPNTIDSDTINKIPIKLKEIIGQKNL